MPKCAVYIYEDTLAPVSSSTIEIIETDYSGVKLDIQMGGSIGANFGADLDLPDPPEPINIWIDDTSSSFSPAALGQLNGQVIARLDIIIYALPIGPGGGGTGAAWSRINEQVELGNWSNSEGMGVRNLVDSTMRALNCPNPDNTLQNKLAKWQEQLEYLRIAIPERRARGGSMEASS